MTASTTETIPWTMSDLCLSAWYRLAGSPVCGRIVGIQCDAVLICNQWRTIQFLGDSMEWSMDRVNWEPCRRDA